ncbi:MAG: ATP-grasp domain-containing protein [Clostridiales Family XIII bacterium]|jgi:D-aspartate ligase|nr:ATP-grasp domain-containing protein [Clostridiales Family XIII bacterium]
MSGYGDCGFIPLLFASDINVYSVARAFHEQYGLRSRVYGKALSGPCANSRILDYTSVRDADRQEVLLALVNDFARAHSDRKILLIGCGDGYVRSISANKGAYAENVIVPYIDLALLDVLTHKERFYALCREKGIDYPDTAVHRAGMGRDYALPFDGPFIIKPSNGVMYWEHPFTGQDKVFKAATRGETDGILDRIYASGYDDSVIIQNFIPGDDSFMRVLTGYSDRNGRVRLSCMGHVLLEEHTPHGIGNHAVILTEYNETVQAQFAKLLEDLRYTGFSNFDLKYDRRDGKLKVFELNARQGRSNYYVTGAGENIARYLVEDFICERDLQPKFVTARSLWMVVPRRVAFSFTPRTPYHAEMKRLIRAGRCANPLLYKADSGLNHRLGVRKNLLGHFFKFAKYYGKGYEK